MKEWKFSREQPCRIRYGWLQEIQSTCTHEKYCCPMCGRKQCILHWPDLMQTEEEAVHFLKSVEVRTGNKCFVGGVSKRHIGVKWKIFTSEADYASYVATGTHLR